MRSGDQNDTTGRNELRTTAIGGSVWWWALFLALMFWYASGALPFGGPQCDAIRQAAGIEHLARYGWEPLLTHNFVGCPGVALSLLALRRLTGVDPLVLQGALSLVFGLVYVLASAGLIHRLIGVATPIAGLALLLSPVAIVAGMYPNDMVPAAALASVAMYFFAGRMDIRNHLTGAVCLGLAGWFRSDAVLITGVIPFIIDRRDRSAWFRALVVIAVVAGGIAVGAVYASGSSVTAIIEHARHVTNFPAPMVQFVGFYASFFPLLLVYGFVLGAIRLARMRQWRVVTIFAVGTIPLWIVHATYPLPKYFTYVIPWFALVICAALPGLREAPRGRRRFHIVVATLLFVGQYVCGLQVTLRPKPWRDPPEPVLATLFRCEFPQGRIDMVAWVIGPGTINTMGHAGTPISGILFTPLVMQREQRLSKQYLDDCTRYVAGLDDREIRCFSKTYDGKSSAMVALVRNGFRCTSFEEYGPQPRSKRFDWQRGDQHAVIYRIYTRKCNMDFLREIGELEGLYFAGSGAEENAMLGQVSTTEKIVRHHGMRVRALYDVTFPPLETDDPPMN
jgi:hypothetical protein